MFFLSEILDRLLILHIKIGYRPTYINLRIFFPSELKRKSLQQNVLAYFRIKTLLKKTCLITSFELNVKQRGSTTFNDNYFQE